MSLTTRPAARVPHLVALGDLLLDVVATLSRPIERGTDVPARIMFRRGGSAANVAAAFAHLGGRASLITSLGGDALGRRLASSLSADGVRVHAVRHAGDTGRLIALVDDRGERSFVTERGVADALEPEQVRPAWLRGADVLHVPAYSLFADPIAAAATRAAALARDHGALVSVDLSSRGPLEVMGSRRARARMAGLAPDILFANREETAALLGVRGRRAWVGLLAHAPLAIVKDGAWGCRVLWRQSGSDLGRQVDVAAQRLGRIDSTGAGDAFAAGFLFALLRSGEDRDAPRDPQRPSCGPGRSPGRRIGAASRPTGDPARLTGATGCDGTGRRVRRMPRRGPERRGGGQAAMGMARSRASPARKRSAQGQRAGRWSVTRRAERVSRPGSPNSCRRSVRVVTMPSPRPMRAVHRATLWAITATASQAPLAANRPDGRWLRPTPSLRSRMAFSTSAWRRWSASSVEGRRRPGR